MDETVVEVKLIPFLIEKITKGVRKQLRGYVQHTQEEIMWSKRHVDNRIDDFERLMKTAFDMKKDWLAVEMMLREHEQNKKLILEMRMLHEEVRNQLMDMTLLTIELQQKIQGVKS